MDLRLDLKYDIQPGSEIGLLDIDERDTLNHAIAGVLEKLPETQRDGALAQVLAAQAHRAVVDTVRASLPARLTATLLQTALHLRFWDGQTKQSRVPHKYRTMAANLRRRLRSVWEEPATETLALSASEFAFLYRDVWLHESVQDAWGIGDVEHVCRLDDELARVDTESK